MTIDQLKELLDTFLDKWSIDDLNKMQLEDYVANGNKDIFCQWVETKTIILGSIKGMTSIKFGIYERKNPNRKPKKYQNDEKYFYLRMRCNGKRRECGEIKKSILIHL